MIYGVILEKYTVPKIVQINVTILRGARRMRFSSKLRATYEDFAPILWETLAYFGYKRYLQRIYISVDHSSVIKAKGLELAILLETMRALKIAYIQSDVLVVGRVISRQKVIPSEIDISKVLSSTNSNHLSIEDLRNTEDALRNCVSSKLYNAKKFNQDWKYILQNLFPGTIITKNSRLDLGNTSTAILRKIVITEYKKIPCTLDLRIKQKGNAKNEFIKSLPLRNIRVIKAECECTIKPCKCTKKQLLDYKKRNSILKVNAWRNVVLF